MPSPARAAPPLPPQGLYEGCAPGGELDTCIARLARIRAAGFRYVLNYSAWYGTPAELLRYADAAQALGLKLIWPLNNPVWRELGDFGANYPSLATNLGGAIGLVADHPATWGFYVGDELPSSEAGRVRRLSALVRTAAPGKPLLYVARPGARHLAPFAPLADVLGADTYPVGSGDPPVPRAARSAHAAASAAGARTAMVLQAFSWSQYTQGAFPPHYPSTATLRAMRDAAIENAHPSLILWYSYQDILRSDDPARRWGDLVRAAFGRTPRPSPPGPTS